MSYASLMADPANFVKLSSPELFDLDYDKVAEVQLHHFKQRFAQLKDRLPALRRLAEDVGIEEVTHFDDLATLAFPHTMYKSYASGDVEAGRYGRISKWLQSFTTHDLMKVDVAGCDSLDEWMDRIEAETPVRPCLSSGTSGKISMFPRSTVEEPFFLEFILRMFDPYKDEQTLNLRDGNIPYLCAWPTGYGRHNFPIMFRLLREKVYHGNNDMLITLGDGFMGAAELWLTGRLRRAEGLGEKLILTPREQALVERMAAESKQSEKRWDRFIDRAVVQMRGKQVLYFSYWSQAYQLALECAARGVKIEWASNSIIYTGGGTKGTILPEGWMDVINKSFPCAYPSHYRNGYGMTETTAVAMRCSAGNQHPLPWGIQHVTDPETGTPLPRKGVQTGRMLVMDLLPTTYWAGTATGDEVTVDWDGGCSCGRKGPFIHDNINRLSESRGGDDKITCAKTPQAYERLEDFLGA